MSIIFGIITAFLQSLGSTYWKKALDHSSMANGLFVIFGPLIGLLIVYTSIIIFNTELSIFFNIYIIILLIIAGIFDGLGQKIEVLVLKKVKMSYILPYRSLDKLFIIILGFIFFFGNEGYTSLITFFIAVITFIVSLGLGIDYKKLKFDKNILIYILGKGITAISVIIVGIVLLEYTTLELFSFFILVTLFFHILANFIARNNFKSLFTQTKEFYKYRVIGTLLGWTGFFLSFLIIEQAGVIVASLISFISIVFSVISMKIVLGDSPNKKQITLAFLVTFLIGVGYYFK